jgi:hypothetical protein
MKYITSNLDYEYIIGNITLPCKRYNPYQINAGKSTVLTVDDATYEQLKEHRYFKRGVEKGNFIVSDSAPIEKLNGDEKAKMYKERMDKQEKASAGMKKDLEEKEHELAALKNELSALKNDKKKGKTA